MITRLEIDGFKSFEKFSVDLAPFTVIVGTNAEFPHLFALREEMRSWRSLQLDPTQLRRAAPVTAADVLDADGSNLAAVLESFAEPERDLTDALRMLAIVDRER